MFTLAEYLDGKRVSELQEFFSFWGTGKSTPSRKAELRTSLKKLLQNRIKRQKVLKHLLKKNSSRSLKLL